MASSTTRPSSRYSAYDSGSSTTSHFYDPSSSSEFNHKSHSSRALVKAKPTALTSSGSTKVKSDVGLTTMVKKLMEKKPSPLIRTKTGNARGLVIPSDILAKDLKKNTNKVTGLTALQKLFGKGTSTVSEKRNKDVKALTEVKQNTRTLAMVLRSERELLSVNKEQEVEIAQLKLMVEEKNKEVENLKDLCLKQREEIKALKNAILFPDVMKSQLQELLEKQGTELNDAKHIIPTLQKQVTSLTGQLQSLAEDLAEVKAEKYTTKACDQGRCNSPRTPAHLHEDAYNSLDFSSDELNTPGGSPDNLFLKDVNPCLTPHGIKTRYEEFKFEGSPVDECLSGSDYTLCSGTDFSAYSRKLSRSSDCCHNSSSKPISKASRKSDETKFMHCRGF